MELTDDEKNQFEHIKPVFMELITRQFNTANQYVTKETMMIKCMKILCKGFSVDWSGLLESTRNTFELDENVIQDIIHCWERKTNSVGLTSEEQYLFERIVSRECVRLADLVKLGASLLKRCNLLAVQKIFAVDGFAGSELKRYVEHLKFPITDFHGQHVRAVRNMYDELGSERIHAVLKHLFQIVEDGSLDKTYMSTSNTSDLSFEGLSDWRERSCLKKYVLSLGRQNLEKIIAWKLKQADEVGQSTESESSRNRKRKHSPSKENHKKKCVEKIPSVEEESSSKSRPEEDDN